MLYFDKSQPAPDCLEIEKQKVSGDYKCGDVLDRIKDDFKNKCYICEISKPHCINVEHFRPHKGTKDLKFSWENLFWSCAHCNNTKLDKFTNILDCTDINEEIEARLRYEFKPFPHERVKIHALDHKKSTKSTCKLIETVFNGSTKLKVIESANLRDSLLKDIRDFQGFLIEYFEETCTGEDQKFVERKIKAHLHVASNFTSFKRWIIKENERLLEEFGHYIRS